jgi:hypothetical protein
MYSEQSTKDPGLPMQVLFGNPENLSLRIICTDSAGEQEGSSDLFGIANG